MEIDILDKPVPAFSESSFSGSYERPIGGLLIYYGGELMLPINT